MPGAHGRDPAGAGRRGPRAGFTLLEVAIAVVLLAMVAIKITLLLEMTSRTQSTESTDIAVDEQARRVLDQIAFALMGADRERLFPGLQSPIHSEEVRFVVSLGVQDGEVVWGDPQRIGLEDQAQLIWTRNPDAPEELRMVWCNVVRPFLEGEVMNGVDDNGNGLVDERGLSFELEGGSITIRLSLERRDSAGQTVLKTVETTVTCRN